MSADVATLSWGSATLAFAILTGLLLASWRGRLAGAMLIATALISVFWAVASGLAAWGMVLAVPAAGALEVARYVAWFGFILSLLPLTRERAGHGLGWWQGLLCVVPLLIGLVIEVAAALAWLPRGSLPYLGLRVALPTLGLILIEQLFRNTPPHSRWGIKFLCLALGAVFAYDLYVYADALLFRRIDVDAWMARGVVNALAVPLIAISAARNKHWSVELAVSRNLVFHSAALLGVGLYLLVMGGVGYYIRLFGGSWGRVLQLGFLFGVGVVLFALLFSGSVRARLRVFLSKHFFSYRFDYREEWLRFTRTLAAGEPGEALNERAIDAIAKLVESPGGALWLRDEAGVFTRIAHLNMSQINGSEPAARSLPRFLGERQWVVSLDEYRETPEIYGDLALPDWLTANPDAWLVVPLILHEDLLGFIVLARPIAPQSLNWELTDLLKVAGRQAAGYLGHLRAAQQLLVARQFESFNKLSAFVIHDLKNLVAQLSLMLANAERHKANPEFQEDMLATVGNVVTRMNRLLGHLRSGTTPVDPPVPVDLAEAVRRAVADKGQLRPAPEVEIGVPRLRARAHPDRLQRVIGHLVQNAIEATPPGGRVWVRVLQSDGDAVVEVGDTGHGMSVEFLRDRLFKPFESTKQTGMGIGTYESRQYVREIGGELEVQSEEGKGSRFRIVLPALELSVAA